MAQAFSNGFEWDCWSSKWCHNCKRDEEFQKGTTDEGCSIIVEGMFEDEIPKQWVDERPGSLDDRYRCTEFEAIT